MGHSSVLRVAGLRLGIGLGLVASVAAAPAPEPAPAAAAEAAGAVCAPGSFCSISILHEPPPRTPGCVIMATVGEFVRSSFVRRHSPPSPVGRVGPDGPVGAVCAVGAVRADSHRKNILGSPQSTATTPQVLWWVLVVIGGVCGLLFGLRAS